MQCAHLGGGAAVRGKRMDESREVAVEGHVAQAHHLGRQLQFTTGVERRHRHLRKVCRVGADVVGIQHDEGVGNVGQARHFNIPLELRPPAEAQHHVPPLQLVHPALDSAPHGYREVHALQVGGEIGHIGELQARTVQPGIHEHARGELVQVVQVMRTKIDVATQVGALRTFLGRRGDQVQPLHPDAARGHPCPPAHPFNRQPALLRQ